MKFPALREIVELAMRVHPADCEFVGGRENAVNGIFDGAPGECTATEMLDYLEAAFIAHEIYCQHEGIDRREEFRAEKS